MSLRINPFNYSGTNLRHLTDLYPLPISKQAQIINDLSVPSSKNLFSKRSLPVKAQVLKNGITLVSQKIPHVYSGALNIIVNVGSVSEDEQNNGITHFIEHMVFKRTKTRDAKQIAEEAGNVGCDLNAFTDKDLTAFEVTLLGENILVPIELFLDMLLNTKLNSKDFGLEKQVILEEIKRYEDAPESQIHSVSENTYWAGHPMGRPILGTNKTVSEMDKDMLKDFLAKHYIPSNMIVSVAGDFDLDAVIKKIEEFRPKTNLEKQKTEISPPTINPAIFVQNKNTEQAHFCFNTKGYTLHDEDRHILAVLKTALGGTSSSRLYLEIREKRGLVYTIHSYMPNYNTCGALTIYGGTNPKNFSKAMSLILSEIKKLKKTGFTDGELNRAKTQLKTNSLLKQESTDSKSF
ncbi:MAG: insulinase family protein [Candidatus Melainabacteria bacterium]|nr:insulinase family protein [Candidatus Melainabacteria bacterium]